VSVASLAATPCAAAPPLQTLAVKAVGADQGVYAEAEDGTVLADVNGDRRVHPASVTKVATTLALLDRLGPDHRFETKFAADGPVVDGTLEGNLLIEAGGDPFFVFESAFVALAELRALGLQRVTGNLRVDGPFFFNWQSDDGAKLKATLAGRQGATVWPVVQARRTDLAGTTLAKAALTFAGNARPPSERHALLAYRSPRLLDIVKALNSYSNNVFHPFSQAIGGPKEVERIARERVGAAPCADVDNDTAAGAGLENRLSPRAAAQLIRALEREAREHALVLSDLLPVAGVDRGTLQDRLKAPETRGMLVGKTGTYGSIGISALAGAVQTRRYGTVFFAVLDKGLSVPKAHARQDAFVRALIAEAGGVATSHATPAPNPLFGGVVERVADARTP
jgi:D-alanyl-D-alanine carboxypeptidase/D-alanyl-D-alanine-endopeptidase (penicillin-binding protein 4)